MNKDQTAPLVYIIVLNYNNYNLTVDCLSSLTNLSYPNFNILVVDDFSENNEIENITNIFPTVSLIRNEKNLNYCKSFNVGIRKALKEGAEYIFLVNNDTKDFSKNYLEEIINTFNQNDNIGMVGSICLDYAGGERRGKNASQRFGIEMDVPTEGYIIKSEVFKRIGLLNEWLVIYFEDLDFIARLRDAGFLTRINLTIKFAHLGGGTTSKVVFTSNYYRIRNLIMFTKKYCRKRPFLTNLKEIKGNLGVHFNKMEKSLKKGQLLIFLRILIAILLGVIIGTIIPVSFGWKEKYMKI